MTSTSGDSQQLRAELARVLREARPTSDLYHVTIPQLFRCNLALGRGLFAKLVLAEVLSTAAAAASASPSKADLQVAMLASLVAVVNSKLPIVGKLVLVHCTRTLHEFINAGCNLREDRAMVCQFIVHLANQGVCGEVLALEMLLALLERVRRKTNNNNSADSNSEGDLLFEFVIGLVYAFGHHLSSRDGLTGALDSLVSGLKETAAAGTTNPKRSDLVDELVRVRATKFALLPSIPLPELDLLLVVVPGAGGGVLHELFLDDEPGDDVTAHDYHCELMPAAADKARVDSAWEEFRRECFGEEKAPPPQQGSSSSTPLPPPPAAAPSAAPSAAVAVEDRTSRDVLEIRKRIYLTINHGLSFEQVAHELILQRARGRFLCGHDEDVVQMLVEFCAQLKSYTDFIGLLCCRLCVAVTDGGNSNSRPFPGLFEREFAKQYANVHQLETTKMRNLAMLLAELLYKPCGVQWDAVFACVELGEHTTTSSSRIFLKFLLQRLAQQMGMDALRRQLSPLDKFPGLFPRGKTARQLRFAVNFFTSIGLGSFTVEMRDWLKRGEAQEEEEEEEEESSSSSSSSDSESSSSSSSEEEEERRKRRKKKHSKHKKSYSSSSSSKKKKKKKKDK